MPQNNGDCPAPQDAPPLGSSLPEAARVGDLDPWPLLRERFPEIERAETWERLAQYCALLREWNGKVNLISRKDIDRLEFKHLAPCLVSARVLTVRNNARFLDIGTGGGLPGLVLAILYPHARLMLVDSVGKKIRVVQDIAQRLRLHNVKARQVRVETLAGGDKFDFVTGRAVTALPGFMRWAQPLVRTGDQHSLHNGVLYWKGGALEPELAAARLHPANTWPMEDYLKNLLPPEDLAGKTLMHFKAADIRRARL